MRGVLTGLLIVFLAAPALTQEPPPIDRALVMQFVQADEAERRELIAKRPEILGAPFRTVLSSQGNSQRDAGELEVAEMFYRSLLFLAQEHRIESAEAVALNSLATLYGQRGALNTATEFSHKAMAIGERIGSVKDVQAAWASLGIIQRHLGELVLAEATLRKAMAMAESINDKPAVARVLNNLGLVYRDRGDAATAQQYLIQSLALKEETGARGRDQASTLTNLGGLFDNQGDFAQALHYYRLAYDKNSADSIADAAMASLLNNLGHIYKQLGRHDEAREFYSRVLAATERSGERTIEGTTLYNLGALAEAEGKLDEAESLHRRALAVREQFSNRGALIESLSGMAHIMDVRGRPADGLPFALRAVTLAEQSQLLNQLWKAQFAEARLRDLLGERDLAAAAYAASIATVERMRSAAAGGDTGRREYLAERVGPYFGLATLKAKSGDGWGALAVMEQSRARALIDIVTSGHQATRNMTPAQRQRELASLQTITALSDLVEIETRKARPNPAKVRDLESQLAKARVERDVVTAALFAERPDLQFARGNAPAISRARLETLLKPSTAVVSYVFDRDAVWAYVVRRTADGIRVTTTRLAADRHGLAHQAEDFSKQVASRDLKFASLASELYSSLMSPIESSLAGATDLIVIPDGPLWSVPFQALMSPRGRFLIEDRAISYTPSLSALDALEARRAGKPKRAPFVLALGDPAFTDSANAAGLVRNRLPEAAREVQAVGKLYGATQSRVLTDAAASEKAFRSNLERATIVHLATHGVLDNKNPMYSRVVLNGAESAAGHEADGRLEAWEILDLGLNADLAILSACDTARGGFGWGEGVIGLSWSLFAAGASTSVVSQWQVDSASTTSLMISFHEQLRKPLAGQRVSSAAALRSAAVRLMSQPATRHPFYWAGFIAIGAK